MLVFLVEITLISTLLYQGHNTFSYMKLASKFLSSMDPYMKFKIVESR